MAEHNRQMAPPADEQPGLEVADEQPGLEVRGDQPGLQVRPEHETPHALYGPGAQKPWHSHPTSPVHGGYGQPPYSPLYPPPPSSHPGTDWNSPSAHDAGQLQSEKPTGGTIMGIRKKKFWLIFGPLIAVLVIGLAVGLGVGLGTQSSDSDASTTASPTPSTVTSVTCPKDNGTLYETNGKDFLTLCNLDYNGGGGTTDLGSVETTTFEQCLTACASNSACDGAGWGRMDGTTTCWLKANLGSWQKTDTAWFFGVRQ